MGEQDITLGEVGRRLDVMTATLGGVQETLGGLVALDAGDRERLKALERRVDGLEGWKTWAVRVVLGLVISAVIGWRLVSP